MARLSHVFALSSDLDRTRRFFADVLGLSVTSDGTGYVRIEGSGGFHIGMEEGDPGPPNSIEITIEVDDVDAVYRKAVAAGVEFEGPPADQPWGTRHAWFRDPDGRRMSIFESNRGR
jgi:catechol 2,3-dioxygenase-like lactoylglutathione lyase family enzyme